MIILIVTTTVASLDAIFIGLYLGTQKSLKPVFLLLIVALITLASMGAYVVARLLTVLITIDNASMLTGLAFLILAIRNIIFNNSSSSPVDMFLPIHLIQTPLGQALHNYVQYTSAPLLNFKYITTIGLIMCVDPAIATIYLTIVGGVTLLNPTAVAFGHLLLLFVGSTSTSFMRISPRLQYKLSVFSLLMISALNFLGIF